MSIIEAFILLLVIMDPILSLSAFLSLAKRKSDADRKMIVAKATLVAALVFLIFAFGGDLIFKILGVDINSFRAAGGILLIILGVQLALGLSFPKKEDLSEIAVVIGTPIISGPATIMTTIILVKDIGLGSTLVAGSLALIVIMASLLFALNISKVLGRGGIQMLSTMMGIVTIAWGIQFLFMGVAGGFL